MNSIFDKPSLIVNPRSDRGKALRSLEQILAEMHATWPQIRVFETKHAGHATGLARQQVQQGASLLLVMGGDGTLNEVVNALGEDAQVPLGILPGGSGNDTARSLGWPSDPNKYVRHLLNSQIKRLDLGLVTSKSCRRYFLNVASCGISALIAEKMHICKETKTSASWAYYLETLKAIRAYQPQPIQVNIDGKSINHPDCSLLAFANGQYFGGGMRIAPGAILDDGRFDEIAVSNMGLSFFLRHGLKVYRGSHLELPQVYKMRGRVAVVECASKASVRIEADGEDAGELPAKFEILHKRLPVLA